MASRISYYAAKIFAYCRKLRLNRRKGKDSVQVALLLDRKRTLLFTINRLAERGILK